MVIGLFVTTWPLSSSAIETVSVSPGAVRFAVNPGQIHHETFTVENGGDQPVHVVADLAMVTAPTPDGQLSFAGATPADVAVKEAQLKLNPTQLDIPAHESARMVLATEPKRTLSPGGYSFGLSLRIDGPRTESAQAGVAQRTVTTLNVPVFVEVLGQPQLEAKLLAFDAQADVADSSKFQLTALTKNSGTIHAALSGTVTLRRTGSTEVLATLPITRTLVLPGAERAVNVNWRAPYPGVYAAELALAVDHPDGTMPTQRLGATTTIRVLPSPLQIVGIGFGLVVVVGGAILFVRRRRAKRKGHYA